MKLTATGDTKAAAPVTNGSVVQKGELEIKYIPIEAILKSKEIPYRELNEEFAAELSADIERHGLETPLHVWNKEVYAKLNDKKIEAAHLISGLHRRAAIDELKKRNPKRYAALFPEGVPCIVSGGEISDCLFHMLRENILRIDMPGSQVLPVMQVLRDVHNFNNRKIAKEVGKSESWVSQVFTVEEELGAEGVDQLSKGKLSFKEARKAAASMKDKKARGEEADAAEEIEKSKEARSDSARSAGKRVKKKASSKTLYRRYIALPSKMADGTGVISVVTQIRKIGILEGILAYLAEEAKKLPFEVREDIETEDAS